MGIPAGFAAPVDPFDQSGATSSNRMGCHGVLARELSQASTLGLAETSVVDRLTHAGGSHRSCYVGAMGEWFSLVIHGQPINYASLFFGR